MTDVSLPRTIAANVLASWIQENDEALRDTVNGSLDGDNLTTTALNRLGLSDATTVRSGTTVVTAAQATSSTSFTTLTTADQVQNVVLPTNGLLYVTYAAQWLGDGNSQAALFIGATQANGYTAASGVVTTQAVAHPGGGSPKYQSLHTDAGVAGLATTGFSGDAGTRATTGFVLNAQPALLTAVAGTYTISVRFRNTGGSSMTVRDRLLYVEARTA